MPRTKLAAGDEVAIMPVGSSAASDVIELAIVQHVNSLIIQLTDNRIYSLEDGKGLTPSSGGFILPATDEHRAALLTR